MKNIKICVENMNALNTELSEVQKNARVRLVTAEDLMDSVETVRKHLDIPHKYLADVRFSVDIHAQSFPSAYSGTPESTVLYVRFASGGAAYLTGAARERCRAPSRKYQVELTPDAEKALLTRFRMFNGEE